MSVHALKPTFTNFAGYKAWRKTWATVYKNVSQRIVTSKADYQTKNKLHSDKTVVVDAWKKLQGERVIAFKLNTVLNEAKIRMNGITTMRKGMEEHQNQFPLEIANCPSLDFHFNKKHLEFPWMPMWVVKTKGVSYYCHHVDANCSWSTRETPDHTSTKGSLRFRKCNLNIDAQGVAVITTAKTITSV